MSLTRMLLNGVTESAVEDMNDFSDVQEMAEGMKAIVEDEPTFESWCDSAMESMAVELYTIDKAYHVADIIGETKVLTEGANPEVLLEGIVKSGIAKIKEAFKKFWAKLKSWFAAVKRQLNIIFKTGKDFIKEFRKEINDKKSEGYKYTGYKYDINEGDSAANRIFETVSREIEAQLGRMAKDAQGPAVASGFNRNDFDDEDAKKRAESLGKAGYGGENSKNANLSQSEMEDNFISKVVKVRGASNIEELRKELTEIYRGSDEMEEIEDFEGNSKGFMMDFIDGFDKKIKSIEDAEKKFDSEMNKIIKAFDKIDKKDVGESAYKAAQLTAKNLNMLLSVGKVPSGVQQAIYKEANGQFERALKGFLRFKPAKEGMEFEEPATDSLLEQAMKLYC